MPARKRRSRDYTPIKFDTVPNQVHRVGTKWSVVESPNKNRRFFFHEDFEQSPNYNFHITVCYRNIEGKTEQVVDHHATHFKRVGLLETKFHHGWVLNEAKKSKWRKLKVTDNPDHPFNKTVQLYQLFEKEKHRLVDPATLRRMRLPKN